MNHFRTAVSPLLSLSLIVVAAALSGCASRPATCTSPVFAAGDCSEVALTPTLITTLESVESELSKLNINNGEKISNGDSFAEMIRKLQSSVDTHPEAKSVLARHGITSNEYAFATLTLFLTEMLVAMEPYMDKADVAKQNAERTPQENANFDLVRKMNIVQKK